MRLEEIEKIEELYLLKNSHRYEIQLIEGLKKDLYWASLSDKEKLELRTKELMKKYVFKEIYSDLMISYEESVIDLVKLIMKFLDEINLIVFDFQNMSEDEFILFRLKNMMCVELYAVNKREKLQYSGHVLFEEVVQPIFVEIERTEFYIQYSLEDLRDTYKRVSDLYGEEPYKK
nr:hypothetical protein [uncultured Flavobacterium sp.]